MGSRGPLPQSKSSLAFKGGVPEAPAWMDETARAEYKRVVELLAEIPGHLQQVDFSTVCTYCQAFADVRRIHALVYDGTAELKPEGEVLISDKGNAYVNPRVNVLSMAHNRMKDSGARLGFSPSDRARVNSKGTLTKTGKPNPLDSFV